MLSYDLIPFPQIRHYKYDLYRNLAKLAAEYLPKILKVNETNLVSPYLNAFTDQKIHEAAQYLKPEFYRQWQKFFQIIYTKTIMLIGNFPRLKNNV